ncbi:glycosyltransferase, partial [Patescibacteria group bacterium]|nr:glycosyltransferase [Patescibacteria group bacterium]
MIHIIAVLSYTCPVMISIIIINYNTRHLLKPCLESLMAQGEKDREIIVIDNNSTDGSCA